MSHLDCSVTSPPPHPNQERLNRSLTMLPEQSHKRARKNNAEPSPSALVSTSELGGHQGAHRLGDDEDEGDEDDEDEEEGEDQEEQEDDDDDSERVHKSPAPKATDKIISFITASSGDAYLLHSATPARTSDTRLSSYIHPPFSLSSYLATLSSVKLPPPPEKNDDSYEIVDKFPKWRYELQQGFNIILYGWGSKRQVVNSFAEEAREHGDVVLVNGYDDMVGMADLLTALEGVVRRNEEEDGGEEVLDDPAKKGKARANKLSPLESRVHRLLPSLSSRTARPIFLVIHSLDRTPALRNPKSISLLALLAHQPRLRFVASIDHLRASLLFPHSLAAGRPTFSSSSTSNLSTSSSDQRSFNFLYHSIPVVPGTTPPSYLIEALYSQTLSHLLPHSVFPPASTTFSLTSTSGTSSGTSGPNQITATSASYVLASVTSKSVSLFTLLASLQMVSPNYLNRAAMNSNNGNKLNLEDGGYVIPPWATRLDKIKKMATDRLLANSNEQVEALLSEFLDHHVVRKGEGAPQVVKGMEMPEEEQERDGEDGDEDEDEDEGDGNEWVWIPLRKEELEEVVQGLEDAA